MSYVSPFRAAIAFRAGCFPCLRWYIYDFEANTANAGSAGITRHDGFFGLAGPGVGDLIGTGLDDILVRFARQYRQANEACCQ